jgi:hypothetical protein
MRVSRSIAVSLLALAGTVAAPAGPAFADRPDHCRQVRATRESTETEVACESPLQYCTNGVIHGGGPLNNATSHFNLLTFTPIPGSATAYSYYATYTVTARHNRGVANYTAVGVLDLATGNYTDIATLASGTGVFQGATSTLFANGVIVNGAIETTLTGTLCTTSRCDD